MTELPVEEERRARPSLTRTRSGRRRAGQARRAALRLPAGHRVGDRRRRRRRLLQSRPETVWSHEPQAAGQRSYTTRHRRHRRHADQPAGREEEHRCRRRPLKRFISPYDDAAPAGAEGWEELYPYYLHFRDDRREIEEGKFWFADLAALARASSSPSTRSRSSSPARCLGQYNTRHYLIPPANGIDYRVHNGYVYMSPVARARGGHRRRACREFLERAGHYFANWPTLLENWHTQDRAGDRRARGDRLRAAARRSSRWSGIIERRGPGQHLRR